MLRIVVRAMTGVSHVDATLFPALPRTTLTARLPPRYWKTTTRDLQTSLLNHRCTSLLRVPTNSPVSMSATAIQEFRPREAARRWEAISGERLCAAAHLMLVFFCMCCMSKVPRLETATDSQSGCCDAFISSVHIWPTSRAARWRLIGWLRQRALTLPQPAAHWYPTHVSHREGGGLLTGLLQCLAHRGISHCSVSFNHFTHLNASQTYTGEEKM